VGLPDFGTFLDQIRFCDTICYDKEIDVIVVIVGISAAIIVIGCGASWRKRPSPVAIQQAAAEPITEMTQKDVAVIREFAKGETYLRQEAIDIHRRYIPHLGVRGTAEMRFMAEIDSQSPDLGLRSQYRRELIGEPAWN